MQGAPPLASPGLYPRFAAKTAGGGSLRAVPATKERGDRGRWNYPSQATAAFEMVLSPGAGRTSAAGGLAFFVACLPCHCGTQRGGLPSLLPACLFTLACFPAPIPPAPFPAGRGRLKVILCKGLRPLHPRGCTRATLAKLWATVCLRSCGEPQVSRRRALVRLSL